MPESIETRLARVEASRDEHREQLRIVTPLVSQYAVLEERQSNFGQDLTEGFKAIREELADIKADQKDRAKERRTMMLALVVCGVGLFGTFVATAVPLLKSPAPITRTR